MPQPAHVPQPTVVEKPYGRLPSGPEVTKFVLDSGDGLVVQVMTYGATMISVETAGRDGKIDNLVTTCPDLDAWLASGSFYGCTVGRFANRIAKGRFEIDGRPFTLATNNGPNHLHGGLQGFDKKNWSAEIFQSSDSAGVRFHYTSPDGEEGYPGNLKTVATYEVKPGRLLSMAYRAETDQATIVNLTNHAYWNLAGHRSGSIREQQLQIHATQYLDVDDGLIPTGQLSDVAGTPLDFRQPTAIGKNLAAVEQTAARGYDHCFAVDGLVGQLRRCAVVWDPSSGRSLEVATTQPGVQLYTANHFDGGDGYPRFGAFCLETQGFPDAPNQPHFLSAVLEPGQVYAQETTWRFGVRD